MTMDDPPVLTYLMKITRLPRDVVRIILGYLPLSYFASLMMGRRLKVSKPEPGRILSGWPRPGMDPPASFPLYRRGYGDGRGN